MKLDIALWIIIILIGAMVMSAGVQGDDANRKEVGGWSVEHYHGREHDLPGANANVDQFYNKMGQYGWTKIYRWKDDDAWESDFEDSARGGDDRWEADSVDLVYFCGHGYSSGIEFNANHNSIPDGYPYFAVNTEIKWGDDDTEWIVLDSCQVLKYYVSENTVGYKYIWERWDTLYHNGQPVGSLTIPAGLHVMMGWDSVAVVYNCWNFGFESSGGIYADNIHEGDNVWVSWHDATKQAKPWWDGSTYKAAMFYGKIYNEEYGYEIFRYSNEYYENPSEDLTWYVDHGFTLKWGYSSWNV